MKSGVRKPTPEELEIINKNFSKRELSADELYVFDVFAADDDTVTAYFSQLGTDMIEAFHRDSTKRHTDPNGSIVGYLFGHNDMMIPSGTIFKSELVTESISEGENKSKVVQRFRPSVFMLKNLNVGGLNTDDYIRAYEAGHTEDVSVGFMASEYICSICGNDIRDFWHCSHMPGRTYVINEHEVENGNGAVQPITKQCTYTVHQGHFKTQNLLELSGVYRGALWGAKIESLMATQKDAKGFGDKMISTNIKDFKPNDILRFNFAFDGSIEKVGTLDANDSGEAKAILTKVRELESNFAIKEKECAELKIQLEKAKADLADIVHQAQETQKEYEKELNRVKLESEIGGHSLGDCEVEVLALKEKIEKLEKRNTQLETENKDLNILRNLYIDELKERCRKLSVGIHGMHFDETLFVKEIVSLSIQDLRAKIEILEKELAQIIPTGRKTKETGSVVVGNNPQDTHPSNQNPKFFKTT